MHTSFLSITFLRLSAEPVQVFCMGQLDPGLSGASNHFRREFFFCPAEETTPDVPQGLEKPPTPVAETQNQWFVLPVIRPKPHPIRLLSASRLVPAAQVGSQREAKGK